MNFLRILKYRRLIAAVIVFLMALLVAYSIYRCRTESTVITGGEICNDAVSWTVSGKPVSFPMSVQATAYQPIILKGTLPTEIPDNYALEVMSLYSKCQVYVGMDQIVSYGFKKPLPFGHMTGNVRVIADITKDMAGEDIKVIFTPYYSLHADISGIRFGDADAIRFQIMKENAFRFAIVIALFTIILIGIAFSFYQYKSRNKQIYCLANNFVFFAVTIFLWIICSSDMPQFFTNSNATVSLISYLCLAVAGIPYLGFCSRVFKKGGMLCKNIGMLGWAIPVFIMVGYVLDLYDPPEILLVTHIYLLVAALVSLVLAVMNFKENVESRILFFSIIVFCMGTGAGVVLYYIEPSQRSAPTVVGVGMLAFVFLLFSLVLYRQMTYIGDRKYMDTYNELAFKDILTGLGNRYAFENYTQMLTEETPKGTMVTLYIMELTNLKRTNDSCGHKEGDRLVAGMAECLNRAFKGIGKVFRLDGGEFGVLVTDLVEMPEKVKGRIDDCVEEYNADKKNKLYYAFGWYEKPYDKSEVFMQDLYRFADQAAFADKQRLKSII